MNDKITYQLDYLSFAVTTSKIEKDWYGWTIELLPESVGQRKVDYIEYILHKSFPDRYRTSKSAETNYKLQIEGYEGFALHINVYFTNGGEVSGTILLPPQFAIVYQKFKARKQSPPPGGPPPIGSPPSPEWVDGIFHAVSQSGLGVERASKLAGPGVTIINLQAQAKVSPDTIREFGPTFRKTLQTTGHVTQFIADSSTEQPFQN